MSQVNNSQQVRQTSDISQGNAPGQRQTPGNRGGRDLTFAKATRLNTLNTKRLAENKTLRDLNARLGALKDKATDVEIRLAGLIGDTSEGAKAKRAGLAVKLGDLQSAKADAQRKMNASRSRLNAFNQRYGLVRTELNQLLAAKSRRPAAQPAAPAAQPQQPVAATAPAAAPTSATQPQRPAFPVFPATGTPQEKMNFTVQLLKNFPNASRAELEANYGDNLKFAGGGQGNVIFVKGTEYVIKQHLAGPEAKTYAFLGALNTFFATGEVTGDLRKCSLEELDRMRNNKDHIRSAFPIPFLVDNSTGNTIAVAPNVTYNRGAPIQGSELADVKIGSRIVSRNELRTHGDKKHSGVRWLMKKFTTRFLPFLKGTKSRGYEFVSQNGSKWSRIPEGRKSEENLRARMREMDGEQLQSLESQLRSIQLAHAAMPMTFVGASAMIAFPTATSAAGVMPRACMGDFAHAMTTGEFVAEDGGIPLPSHTYAKYKNNFDQGIGALLKLVSTVRASRGLGPSMAG